MFILCSFHFVVGSRTIRTEEAILISLAALEDKFNPVQRPIDFDLSEAIPQSEDTGVPQYAFNEPAKRKQKHKKITKFDNGDDEAAATNTNSAGNISADDAELSRFD